MKHGCKIIILLAGALLLSACETFHYGDKIRLRGAEVALLNWEQKDMPEKARVDARQNTVLYRRAALPHAGQNELMLSRMPRGGANQLDARGRA